MLSVFGEQLKERNHVKPVLESPEHLTETTRFYVVALTSCDTHEHELCKLAVLNSIFQVAEWPFLSNEEFETDGS